jgi:large subunit ribosomal protein L10
MNREEKSAAIEEIAAQIEGSEAIFAVDYRGISVSQAAELRAKLREADASFRVVKNRLTKLAAGKAGEERLEDLLKGPTALTFVRGDTAQAAKAINTFNREHDVLTFKGGFMGELLLDEDKFRSIARLPAREVLDGQLAGVVASPLTGLVRGLGSMIQGLALQLGQIAEKGLVSGEAPAEPPAADPEPAAEETPAEEPAAEADEAPETSAEVDSSADETPADPGSEAEESAADGEAQSPSEEESNSDSSTTSEGDESSETPKED